ncbi:hypothetical protein SBOR_3852 [Sclerotinia borealis F-4128]|uniref:Uncharacterized protein n=1 Tax=Sclerotinia borealis (strain F-4128) TaxID=1432307 RepID=W9CMJ4_SCLBF|nr:hypothetical protein SBOR_3852 [Sclerotinia borealis F-4128]
MNGSTESHEGGYRQAQAATLSTFEALRLARETEEGSENPLVNVVLEIAIREIWSKIQAEPNTCVLTQEEYGVFNYFQNRFQGLEVAVAARRRYWDFRISGST